MYQQISQNNTYPFYPPQLYVSAGSSVIGHSIFEGLGKKTLSSKERTLPLNEPLSSEHLTLFKGILSSSRESIEPNIETRSVTPFIIESISESSAIISVISETVSELIRENEIFKEINKEKIIILLSDLISQIPKDKLQSVSPNELKKRIEKIMFVEICCGILSDLSPSQIVEFDETIKRRKFF